jgi:hypothetical protein
MSSLGLLTLHHGTPRAKFDQGGALGEPMGLSDASDEGGIEGRGKEGRMAVQCGTVGQETTTLDEL